MIFKYNLFIMLHEKFIFTVLYIMVCQLFLDYKKSTPSF